MLVQHGDEIAQRLLRRILPVLQAEQCVEQAGVLDLAGSGLDRQQVEDRFHRRAANPLGLVEAPLVADLGLTLGCQRAEILRQRHLAAGQAGQHGAQRGQNDRRDRQHGVPNVPSVSPARPRGWTQREDAEEAGSAGPCSGYMAASPFGDKGERRGSESLLSPAVDRPQDATRCRQLDSETPRRFRVDGEWK